MPIIITDIDIGLFYVWYVIPFCGTTKLFSEVKNGKTPLDLAIEKGNEKVCNHLKLYEDLTEHPHKRHRF